MDVQSLKIDLVQKILVTQKKELLVKINKMLEKVFEKDFKRFSSPFLRVSEILNKGEFFQTFR